MSDLSPTYRLYQILGERTANGNPILKERTANGNPFLNVESNAVESAMGYHYEKNF